MSISAMEVASIAGGQIAKAVVVNAVRESVEQPEAQELREKLHDMTSEASQRTKDVDSYENMQENVIDHNNADPVVAAPAVEKPSESVENDGPAIALPF